MEVLHHRDQLPFGPHSDAVWAVGVDDFERQWRRKFEVLHCKADRGGAITDHADVRRCREELEKARARILGQAKAHRQRIVAQLRNSESDGWAQEGEKTSLKRMLPASDRARSGASGADSNGAAGR
jgi:hypothetical protein